MPKICVRTIDDGVVFARHRITLYNTFIERRIVAERPKRDTWICPSLTTMMEGRSQV